MAPQPDPQLLPPQDDPSSGLSQKYGRETNNYFAGVPVNRLAWLRTDYDFLRRAFQFPAARFIAVSDLNPLTESPSKLAPVSLDDLEPVTGRDPFGPSEDDLVKNFDSSLVRPLVVWVGILESDDVGFEHKNFKGRPVFAVDVTPRGPYADAARAFAEAQEAKGNTFLKGRIHATLDASDAAMFALARSTIDWNTRNQFCGGCGQRTLAGHAGFKRICAPTDLAGAPPNAPVHRADCPTRGGVSNLSFPRTDPVIIAAVVSSDGARVLLGRNKRYPPNWYSTLAGFLEPGESIEEAVRREILEEAGVRCGRVVIHSSQPWPYPASLMIGAVAQALPGHEEIDLGNDPELEDARWVELGELREALEVGVSGLGDPAPEGYKEGGLRLPPHTAIANRLLSAVAEGFAGAQAKI